MVWLARVFARQHVAVGVIGEGFRAAQRIGCGGKPVEPVIGKAGGMVVGVGETRKQPIRRIALLQQRSALDGEV
jgi:hypothetical protein